MSDIKTLTVDELIAHLTKFPHDAKVYTSIDPEGNGYNALSPSSVDYTEEDKAIILWPSRTNLEADEILPNWWEAQD